MEADFCDDEDLLDWSWEEFRVYDEECIENKTPLILPKNEWCSEKEEQEEDEKLLDEESKNVEDLFEIEEVIGDKFMAIKPWRGAIFRPTHYNEPNPDKPDERYKLEYVFGYRAEDSRNNLFYNKEGNIVYMTACLGVILNKRTNDQTFFGGIEVEHHEKQSARDLFNHTNDIMAMEVSNDRKIACSGQNGSQPSWFIWDAITGEVYRRFILPKGARGVVAIGFSEDNAYVATIDNSDDHVVRVFDVQTSKLIFEQKTGGNQVFDLEWSRKPGHYEFATCGVKHFIVFKPLENIGKSGVSGSKGEMSSHACVTYDENGTWFSGWSDSRIYCWRNRQLMKAYQVHAEGFVGAIKVFGDRIFSGGKDGFIVVSDPNTGKVERKVQVGALVRAIDFMDGNILVGDREGTIFLKLMNIIRLLITCAHIQMVRHGGLHLQMMEK